jgi:uncharacterized DUF497 family protein
VQYEWDNGKAADNLRSRHVDFIDAIAALEDPNRLEDIDARFPYGEERIRDDEICRIISARKATRHEQDRYYAGDPEAW